jgi:hypothetical protein
MKKLGQGNHKDSGSEDLLDGQNSTLYNISETILSPFEMK